MSDFVATKRYKTFDEINHKMPLADRERLHKEAVAELERMGYGALRKARRLTQNEIAERLQISQPSVAALEQRTDIMLSTLAKYIEALGGRLEISAVFPEASFNLAPPGSAFHEGSTRKAESKPQRRSTAAAAKKSRRKAA